MKKVGIIAPSGSVENIDEIKVKEFFDSKKIEVEIFPSCFEKFRYMAGSDDIRLNDIHCSFSDKSIDTIICARGGFGALRLLDKIDYSIIKENKKNFIGFSDVTALLVSFYKNANLPCFHGKMLVNGVLNMDNIEFENYKNSIENPSFKTGLKNGILWGGNLATIVSLFGSKTESYLPNEDIILFLEDINEPDYKIDRMLTQILRKKELTSKIKGVIFGSFTGCGKYIENIKEEFIQKLDVPYENNPDIGHVNSNIVVPFGYRV